MFHTISQQQINKLGNTLMYFAKNVSEFNKTKALKLLFLLEESCVKKFAQPMLGFPFQVWQFGPVQKDVYVDLTEHPLQMLGEFIDKASYNNEILLAKVDFNDDYFSDDEVGLLEDIVRFAKHKTTQDLIQVTHKPGSLWHTIAQRNGVLNELEKQQMPTTDILIDFSILFENDEQKRINFLDAVENFEMIHCLKLQAIA
jgi:uncharacterized phage-associated protein